MKASVLQYKYSKGKENKTMLQLCAIFMLATFGKELYADMFNERVYYRRTLFTIVKVMCFLVCAGAFPNLLG